MDFTGAFYWLLKPEMMICVTLRRIVLSVLGAYILLAVLNDMGHEVSISPLLLFGALIAASLLGHFRHTYLVISVLWNFQKNRAKFVERTKGLIEKLGITKEQIQEDFPNLRFLSDPPVRVRTRPLFPFVTTAVRFDYIGHYEDDSLAPEPFLAYVRPGESLTWSLPLVSVQAVFQRWDQALQGTQLSTAAFRKLPGLPSFPRLEGRTRGDIRPPENT